MGKPRIIRVLDATTGHLPKDVCQVLNNYDGVIATDRGYGWLLWVPEDPTEHAKEYADTPAEVITLQVFARDRGCDYVLLDRDADRVDGLPHWEW